MKLETFFEPRSVAVIGASSDKTKVGYALLFNILSGSKRDVYPVTLNQEEVQGLRAYKSVLEIPADVDLAVIAVRADLVAGVLRDCAKKNIKNAVVISAGFKEVGEKGKEMEDALTQIAKENGIELLGPNCLGFMNTQSDFNASFAVGNLRKGNISFLSQSGALGTAMLDWANKEKIGFSKFISLGNEASLSEMEFLEYLEQDETTKAILLYVEKISDGPRFIEVVKKITAKKPLIILRAGRSARGGEAVMSHTGSLAPADAVFTAACKQAGAITVSSLRELFNFAKLFQMGMYKPVSKIAIVTNGGGPSVNTADLVDLSATLSLVTFNEETKEALKKALPSMAAVGNPIDVIGDAGSSRYDDVFKILNKEDDIDAIICIVTPQMMTDVEAISQVVVAHAKEKPILTSIMGGDFVRRGIEILEQGGLVNFEFPNDIVETLELLSGGKNKKSTAVPNTIIESDLEMLGIEETMKLLNEYGVHFSGVLMKKREDIQDAIEKLGGTSFSLKAISPDIIHKSDAHAVVLNLGGAPEVNYAWNKIIEEIVNNIPTAKIEGMFLQKMREGKQLIVGMKRDPVFGPVILFGFGGIFVEILKDVTVRIAPVDREEAFAQIYEVKGYPILAGARGEKLNEIGGLADIIVALSKLSMEHPEIQEIDLNPIMLNENSATAVDARMMVKNK
jgi:acetyltransferase